MQDVKESNTREMKLDYVVQLRTKIVVATATNDVDACIIVFFFLI